MVFGFLKPSYKLDIHAKTVPATGPVEYDVVLNVLKPKEIKKLRTRLKIVVEGRSKCEYREEDEEGRETTEYRMEDYEFTLAKSEEVLLEKSTLEKGVHTFHVSIPLSNPMPLPGAYRHYSIRWIAEAEIPGLLKSAKATADLAVRPPDNHGDMETRTVYMGDVKVEAEVPSYVVRGAYFPVKIRLTPTKGQVECKRTTIILENKTYTSWRDISLTAETCDTISETRELHKETIGENIKLDTERPLETTVSLNVPPSETPGFNYQASYSQWKIVVSCSKGMLREDRAEIPLTII